MAAPTARDVLLSFGTPEYRAHGLARPDGLPPPRLFEVPLPEDARIHVQEYELVEAGRCLAWSPQGEVAAPCRAVVVHLGPERLLLRRGDD